MNSRVKQLKRAGLHMLPEHWLHHLIYNIYTKKGGKTIRSIGHIITAKWKVLEKKEIPGVLSMNMNMNMHRGTVSL